MNKMYTLAFDTTANGVSVLLSKDGRTIDLFQEEMDFGQAEVLIPEIRNTLEAENLQFKDLGLAVVCTGPGSFTGVRSSISAARAFGLACPKTKIIGVSAFEAYAHSLDAEETAKINAVIIETKREDFYYQLFDEKLKKLPNPPPELTKKSLTGFAVPKLRWSATASNVFKQTQRPEPACD